MNNETCKIKELKKIIDKSKRIVLFTGAGISVPSGIPDFRSANGIYNEKLKSNYSPEEIISHSFFMSHPDIFYEFFKEKMVYPTAKPNIAHEYFAQKEKEGKLIGVITQNIDGLHQMAGSINVVELHGTVHRAYCMRCGKEFDDTSYYLDKIPHCSCGGLIKPDVVLYEESLKDKDIKDAVSLMESADTLIVVGTSLIVYPAAAFINYFMGDNLVLINKSHLGLKNCLEINDDIVNVIKELREIE